ncbi:endonuclease NucS domain-containing protein [Aminobacter aganoensis]|uniref:Endonuclease NucS C-terminal domain-containing protein n=1 Tax=Aminobacter aganoensis TaxID=83264 RepID=A0A7X0FAW8_9HYPH|nr:hypothetical protein [Aminobacter aganoensis]
MFEAPLRDLLASQLEVLEDGLTLLKIEQFVPSTIGTRSFIDILARDKRGRWVLIELKRSDAASREAIHEIYKYVEAVKGHLGARDDEIRAIIVSTEWKELLVPFSRFVQDTSISANGVKIILAEPDNTITAQAVEPLALSSGRVLSPWHEISLYRSEKRLQKGIASYDASCRTKGINDYIMVEMQAPEGFYEASVLATARSINGIRGGAEEPTEEEIADVAIKMKRMDHLIYFVPQLQSPEEYLEIIRNDQKVFREVEEFMDDLEGEELLSSLLEYALFAKPKIDRDYFEIGYPAKFRTKLLDGEGWTIKAIHRRGAFERNSVLTDETILGEIAGEAGTSGQRLKRSIILSDRAEVTQLLKDVSECLPNNPVWAGMIRDQLEEARTEFPKATVDVSIYSPSTGMLTLFFTVTQETGALYVPTYTLAIQNEGELRRIYIGELSSLDDNPISADAFTNVLSNYYEGDIGMLVMTMTWGGYEARDIDILEDLNLGYGSFRCDAQGDERQFYRMKNRRWRQVPALQPFGELKSYLERNERLVRIIAHKLGPRIGPGICDGSRADRQLEDHVDPLTVKQGKYYIDPPNECDICSIPLSGETFMSDTRLKEHDAAANMCADCTIYYGAGIGWGVGQLYRNEGDGKWLLVGGFFGAKDDDDSTGP